MVALTTIALCEGGDPREITVNPITGNVYVASAVNRDDGTVSIPCLIEISK